MLTKVESEGCRKILDKLNYSDLASLVDTTTKKQIKVSRTSEAIKAIIEYTPSALDLLKRKKVKREFLFSYLVEERVIVQPSVDKSGLIRTILKRWGSDLKDFEMYVDLEDDTFELEPALDPGYQQQPTGNQPKPSTSQGTSTVNQPGQLGTSQGIGTGNQPCQINIQYSVNQYINSTSIHRETNTNSVVSGPDGVNSVLPGHHTQLNNHTADVEPYTAVSSDIQVLGEKFAEWFYENLNSHSPGMQKTPGDFGPHHFWDDTYLVLNSFTPEPNSEKLEGPFLVSQRFLSFAKDEQLLFNPNLTTDGIYVKSNPHGLVMILVCGTIHRNNECLGVFQQIFGIVKDPRFENNWKIKMTKLEVGASRPTAIPKLEGNLDMLLMAV